MQAREQNFCNSTRRISRKKADICPLTSNLSFMSGFGRGLKTTGFISSFSLDISRLLKLTRPYTER